MALLDELDRTAVRVLVKNLGWLGALRVGAGVEWRTRRGEPFADLPPAVGFHEEGSRAQAGPAIVMYRILCDRVGRDEALRITGEVIDEAAQVFLAQSVGTLDRDEIDGLDEEGRDAFARDRAARFPNATLEWNEISSVRVAFTVTACRLHSLVVHAGHPELGPLFCKGDARFFAQKGVRLTRPGTLAQGHDGCPFSLEWE